MKRAFNFVLVNFAAMIPAMLIFACAVAYAQQVAPPTFLDGVLTWIQNHPVASWSGGLGFLFEAFLRLIPTAKPLSLLIPAKYVFDGIGVIAGFGSAFVNFLITSVNNVTPPPPGPAPQVKP